jgi:hypothetical protein
MNWSPQDSADVLQLHQIEQRMLREYDSAGGRMGEYAAEVLQDSLDQVSDSVLARAFCIDRANKAPTGSALTADLMDWWQASLCEPTHRGLHIPLMHALKAYEVTANNPPLAAITGKIASELTKRDILQCKDGLTGTVAEHLLSSADTPEVVADLLAAALVIVAPEITAAQRTAFATDSLLLATKLGRPELDELAFAQIPQLDLQGLDHAALMLGKFADGVTPSYATPGARFLPALAQAYPSKLQELMEHDPGTASMFYNGLRRAKQAGEPHACDPTHLPLAKLFTSMARGEAVLAAHYASTALKELGETPTRITLLQDFAAHSASLPHGPALTFLATLHCYLQDEGDIFWTSRAGLISRFGALTASEQAEYLPEVCEIALSDKLLRVAICKAYPQNLGLTPN